MEVSSYDLVQITVSLPYIHVHVTLDLMVHFICRLCEKKQWYTTPLHPRLIMALPHSYRAKDNVVIKSYTESSKIQKVFDWVNMNLASRIKNISTLDQLRHNWFTYEKVKEQSKLKVVLFSKLKIPPMFYSVLSVKFSGRVNFGTIDIGTKTGEKIAKELGIKKFPLYLILTPEKNYTFGIGQGEYLNYHSMGLFLKTLHPEVNDTFLLSLVVMNIICWFELFISPGNLFKRLGSFLWHLGKWNFLLILLWLPILGLFQLPYMDMVLDYALTILRTLGTTRVASMVREDFIWYSSVNCSFLIITFLLFASIVGVLHYLYKGPDDSPADQNNNNTDTWWNFQWDMYMSYFFRPMATLTRPMSPQDLDLEVGMELLIERLAVPNFWLRPMISSQYINDLPVWKYTGPSIDSDIGSDTDAMSMVSDGEDAGSGGECATGTNGESDNRPYMFICEKCRALQSKKTEQELEQERIESESACAKYLMDGDYKCTCQCNSTHDHGTTRRSPKKERYKNGSRSTCKQGGNKPRTDETDTEPSFQMPPGILPTTECAICLESYKYGVNLCGLPCGHCFHQYCIMGWLTRDNHCCPVCRWPPYKAKPCSMHLHAE